MKRYIAVLELEADEESIEADVKYNYSSNGKDYSIIEHVWFEEQINKTYEDGLEEAWELVRDIIALPNSENKSLEMVRYNAFADDALFDIIRNHSASEIIKKIKEYEEIKIGDEVVDKEEWGIKGVVTETTERLISIVEEKGNVSRWKKENFEKTGRHFSEIEEVLKKMKENE